MRGKPENLSIMRDAEVINPEVRYEHRGIRLPVLLIVAAAIVVLSLLMHSAIALMYRSILKREPEKLAEVKQELDTIRAPRLQTEPQVDLRRDRDSKLNDLNSYGWVDESRGVVHIPIDKAMEVMIQRSGQAK
jgi:hypothetical protein